MFQSVLPELLLFMCHVAANTLCSDRRTKNNTNSRTNCAAWNPGGNEVRTACGRFHSARGTATASAWFHAIRQDTQLAHNHAIRHGGFPLERSRLLASVRSSLLQDHPGRHQCFALPSPLRLTRHIVAEASNCKFSLQDIPRSLETLWIPSPSEAVLTAAFSLL